MRPAPSAVILALLLLTSLIAAPRDNPVILTVGAVDTVSVAAGDTTWVAIPLKVARGYHVNANPASSEDYIPLEVVLPDTGLIRAGDPVYPKGKVWRLKGTAEDLWVYGGTVEIRVPLIVAREMPAQEVVLKGSVEFQACDDEVCFLPDSRPFHVNVVVRTARGRP
jgi:hypothetical protein